MLSMHLCSSNVPSRPKSWFAPACRRGAVLAVVSALLLGGGCGGVKPEELVEAATKRMAERDHAGAVIQLKSALQVRPDWPEVRVLLARALLASGDREPALAELSKLVSDPATANEAVPLLMEALLVGGESRKAVTLHANYKLTSPQAMADYKSWLATAWLALGERDRARTLVEEVLQATPDHRRASVMLARMDAGAGKLDVATTLVDALLANRPLKYQSTPPTASASMAVLIDER
jgi:thioredoxin-like negative regulator of GroEL